MAALLNVSIKESNIDRVNNAINAAQTHARTRLINYTDITDAIKRIELKFGVSRNALKGVIISCDIHAQHYPSAYKGIPESTQFTLKCTGRAWVLINVWRGCCNHAYKYNADLIPEDTKIAIIRQLEQFK